LFIMGTPLVTSAVLLKFGLAAVFLTNAAAFALLIPVLFFVIENPEAVGQLPRGAHATAQETVSMSGPVLSNRDILMSRDFWLLSVAAAILTASSIVMVVQLVPFLNSRGIDLSVGSKILSVYAVASALGTLIFGWLADRIGVIASFMVSGFLVSAPWIGLMLAPASVPVYFGLAVVAALCNGGVSPLHAGCANELFGRRSYSRAIGLSYFAKLPALVAAAPLAGWTYDLTGSYNAALVVCAVMVLAASGVLWILNGRRSRAAAIGLA